MDPAVVLAAIGPSTVAAAVLLALGQQPWRSGAPWSPGARATLGALAAAVALIVAYASVRGWPGFWPSDATARLPLVAVVGAAAQIVVARARRNLAGFIARVAAVSFVLAAIAQPYLAGVPLAWRALLWYPGVGLAILVWWLAIDRLSERERGACWPLLLWLTASATSMLVLFAIHTASLGLLAASLAGPCGVLVVFALWRARVSAAGAAGVTAVLLASLLFIGARVGGLGPLAIGLVAAAPLTVLLRRIPAVGRLPGWASALVCLLAAAALVAPPAILAFRAYDPG